jgi:hypothetical protein
VLALLGRVRAELNELWQRVCAHNAEHPLTEDERVRVRFYFGQNVIRPDEGVKLVGEAL